MTLLAVGRISGIECPCAIVALAAEFALCDIVHCDRVAPQLRLEYFWVAVAARQSLLCMYPPTEHYIAHALYFEFAHQSGRDRM